MVLDSLRLSDLPGVTEPVDARTIELGPSGGLIVGGRDLLVEFGPAFDLRRRVAVGGTTVTTIALDIDGRMAYLGASEQAPRIISADSRVIHDHPVPVAYRGEVLFVDDGSIAVVNLSLRRAERLVETTGIPVDLFSTDSSVIDAVARGPGGEIWIADRANGRIEVRASDGTFIQGIPLPGDIVGVPVRAISVGADGSIVLLVSDRLVRLDPAGTVCGIIDVVHTSAPIPVSQVRDIAYRSESGELYLLDAGGAMVHRVLLDGAPASGVVAELARLKEEIDHAPSRSAVRRLRLHTMATYERNGATLMADRIRADLIYEDPFEAIPDVRESQGTQLPGLPASFQGVVESPVPPGLDRLADQIGEVSRDIGYPGYDLLGRGIVAWELARALAPIRSETLGPVVRPRPSAIVLRHGYARREELLRILVDLWTAAGLEARILEIPDRPESACAAFRSGVPWDQRRYLGPLSDAAIRIDGESWIAMSPDALGQSFLYAAATTAGRLSRSGRGYETPPTRIPTRTDPSGEVPLVAPPPTAEFRDEVARSLFRVENAVRKPILASARERRDEVTGRSRMEALNALALAELSAGVPDEEALSRARSIWRELLQLDPRWAPALRNLELLDRLAEGRVELFSLPWVW